MCSESEHACVCTRSSTVGGGMQCFANCLHVHKCKPQDVSLHRCRTLTWTTGSNLLLWLFVVRSHGGMFVFTLIVRSGLWGQVFSIRVLVRKHPKINWLCSLLRWCLWANWDGSAHKKVWPTLAMFSKWEKNHIYWITKYVAKMPYCDLNIVIILCHGVSGNSNPSRTCHKGSLNDW